MIEGLTLAEAASLDLSLNPLKRHKQVREILEKVAANGADVRINPSGVHFPESDTVFVHTKNLVLGRNALMGAAVQLQCAEINPWHQVA